MTTTTMERRMTLEAMLRLIAGVFLIASVLLGMYVDARFFWFTLFVGVKQSFASLHNNPFYISHIHLMTPAGLESFADKLGNEHHEIWAQIFDEALLTKYQEGRVHALRE